MSRHPVSCDDVAPSMFDVVERSTAVGPDVSGHVEQCLRCQAEVAQHRKIGRVLRAARSTTAEPPADLVLGILAAVAAADDQRDLWSVVLRHRATYVAAATAATAGAAAGAFVLSRSRRTRLVRAG